MISYNELYAITTKIFFSFKNKRKTDKINHKISKIEKLEKIYNLNKMKSSTKENFILINLYLNFKKSFSSQHSIFESLNSLDKETFKEVLVFKNEIKQYKFYLKKDIELITNKNSIDIDSLKKLYLKKEISWYTLYFYIKFSNCNYNAKSRYLSSFLSKSEVLMFYINFDLEFIEKNIRKLYEERLI